MACDAARVYGYTLASLVSSSPLAYAILSSIPVVIGESRAPVATDGRVVVVNPELFCRLPPPARMLALLHAALHLMGRHPERALPLGEPGLIAADVVVDAELRESGFRAGNEPLGQPTIAGVAKVVGIAVDELRRMSLEEIARLLSKSGVSRMVPGRGQAGVDLLPPASVDVGAAAREGRVVNPGPVDDASELASMTPFMVAELVRKRVEALATRIYGRGSRKAGIAPGFIERRVEPSNPVDALWELLVYASGYNYTRFKRSWSRRSRRVPVYPGKVPSGAGRLWILLDTSGSVGDDELSLVVEALAGYAMHARPSRILLVEWDTGVRKVVELASPDELLEEARSGLKGGGGTVMAPALRLLAEEAYPSDTAVLVSDYYVSDEDESLTAAVEAAGAVRILAPVAVPGYNKSFYEKLLSVTGTPPVLLSRRREAVSSLA